MVRRMVFFEPGFLPALIAALVALTCVGAIACAFLLMGCLLVLTKIEHHLRAASEPRPVL